MATLRSAIQITDGMSPALRAMNKSLNIVISSFEHLQESSGRAVDTASIKAARNELNRAEAEFRQIDSAIEKARQSQEQFNHQAERSSGILNTVKRAAGGIGAAIGVKKIIEMSDTLVSTRARLDLMNDGLQTTAELQDMIYRSAQRSRASYTDTASAVSKLGILAKDAFSSNQEMVVFAELMNKQFKIGGASIQEQTSAMYQLTQAMAAGKLQGDEFRSIMENAPMLAQAIADHMGKPMGELKELSSQGVITADVIKNAMFAAADQTNAKFAQMPVTWGQVWTVIKNDMITGLEPIFSVVAQGAMWVHDNLDAIRPVAVGAATALSIYAAAMGIKTAAEWLSVASNKALIATMLSNPIMWIALLIGVLIGWLYKWVEANGGVQVSLMKLQNYALIAWDAIRIGGAQMGSSFLGMLDNLAIGSAIIGANIVNFFGDMKVGILTHIQNMVNGAIDHINKLIELANKIPGVSIDTIQNVTFASTAAVENEAKKQARAAELAEFIAGKESARLDREANIASMQDIAASDRAAREAVIAETQAAKLAERADENGPMMSTLGSIDESAKGIKDAVTMTAEDLKYMRDLAEQEVVNRFTTAEIKVDMGGVYNSVASGTDLDGVVAYLEDKLTESMNIIAEGVPVNV